MEGGWIDWTGGECPEPGRSDIEVRFRSGTTSRLDISHREDWGHEPNDQECDIVAYRVAKP